MQVSRRFHEKQYSNEYYKRHSQDTHLVIGCFEKVLDYVINIVVFQVLIVLR